MTKPKLTEIPWKKIKDHHGATGWRRVFGRLFELPNGVHKSYDITDHNDCVVIFPVTPDNRLVMVQQYRPGPEQFMLELPGGLVDPGEKPEHAAARELREETGFSGDLSYIGVNWLSAYSVGRKHVFLCQNAKLTHDPDPEDDEFIETLTMDLNDFRKHLKTADMVDTGASYRALEVLDKYDSIE